VVKLKNEGAEGIILDLRGNGGGLLDEAVKIVSLFVPKGTLVVTSRGRIPGSIRYYKTDTEPLDTEIPLAVLVNSGTASSSEIVSGSLQDLDRATIIGTRTFGKGLVQSIVPVGYGGKLKVTTAKYYTPSGRCVQAIDYSHRNPDGSVGSIPDSLKKPFKTMHGRTVYDGGGITPDTLIPSVKYSRPTMSLLYNDIFGDYARKFYAEHDSISLPENFAMTEKEYSDFVEYASARKFDSRSAAQVALDDIIKDAKDENMYDLNKQEFEALSKKLNISKTQMLRIKEKEFKPVLESEIVRAYYYNAGSAEFILRYDKQFAKALKCFREVIAKRNPDKPLE
jgi:carboxyl-terminal processing protease